MNDVAKAGARRRIGILSPCGTGNIGDEATVAVLIEEITRRYPTAEIYGITTDPEDTRRVHGIRAYPSRNITGTSEGGRLNNDGSPINSKSPGTRELRQRLQDGSKRLPLIYPILRTSRQLCLQLVNMAAEARFIKRSLEHLSGTDLLIVAGSGQLLDNYYAVWGFPYTLLKWAAMAKACGAKLAFVSCGAGPIDASLSKLFIKWALKLADYRSFRDRESKGLIEKIGFTTDDPVTPDLVFSAKFHANAYGQGMVVAINASNWMN